MSSLEPLLTNHEKGRGDRSDFWSARIVRAVCVSKRSNPHSKTGTAIVRFTGKTVGVTPGKKERGKVHSRWSDQQEEHAKCMYILPAMFALNRLYSTLSLKVDDQNLARAVVSTESQTL